MAELDRDEFLQRRDMWEANGNRLMAKEDVERFDAFFADDEASREFKNEGFARAQVGDFSQFESVEPMLKGYLGAKKCYDLFERYNGDASSPELQQELKERLMEADLRTGFAFGGKDPDDPFSQFLKDCERIANRQMLIQTLEGPDPSAKLRLLNQFKQENPENAQQMLNEALGQDLEQRVQMAKILFLNHLGKFQLQDSQKQPMEMNENMAEIYAHGGRTMFILPAGENQTPVMDGIQGHHPEQSGFASRGWATHGAEPRKFNSDGTIASEAKELKVRGLGAYAPSLHRGMNVSVGGFGHVGPNGRTISADGTNGHMYMHLIPGEKNTCGTMLVGFENSGPGKKGRLGHTHDASAKKAGSSAFLSDKSYLGKETGGRVVDLSGLTTESLSGLLDAFENAYRNAATAAQTGDSALLDSCNELLTGKPMSVGQLKGMLQGMQVPDEQIASVEPAREGHPAAKGHETISPSENPPVPMNLAENSIKRPFRVTQCDGLVPPEPPAVMKKPGFWQKVAHVLSLFSKNSYVSRYEQYQQNLQSRLDAYDAQLKTYNDTLEALERGENPNNLKESYDRARQQAEATFGIAPVAPAPVQQNEPAPEQETNVKTASEQLKDQLENTLLDMMFEGLNPTTDAQIAQVEELKVEFREHIRNSDNYNRLLQSGDENITRILGDSDSLTTVATAINQEILNKLEPSKQVSDDNVPQRNKELESTQAQNVPMALG